MERTVKLPLILINLHNLMPYGELEVCMHAFLASGVDRNGCLASFTHRCIYKLSNVKEAEWESEPV